MLFLLLWKMVLFVTGSKWDKSKYGPKKEKGKKKETELEKSNKGWVEFPSGIAHKCWMVTFSFNLGCT